MATVFHRRAGVALSIALLAAPVCADALYAVDKRSTWQESLSDKLAHVETELSGEVGVYIEDLHSGESFSWRAGEPWYLASLIKVPVAVEVLARVEAGEFSLDDRMTLTREDYIDGAGETNWHEPGSRLRIDFLLEQMLTHSDNTATDLLIRLVGQDAVNQRARAMVAEAGGDPAALGRITTLADVRRHLYGELHPGAFELSGMDFIDLRRTGSLAARVAAFADRLGVAESDLRLPDYASAFDAYEAEGLNTGHLSAFGALLAALYHGDAGLREISRDTLIAVMRLTTTGEQRLKAGFPESIRFAHKTGTQYRRSCDAGIAEPRTQVQDETQAQNRNQAWVVVACARGPAAVSAHERALGAIGSAMTISGVFSQDGS
ncbi:serine hydrolase [Halomonas sp. Bachu 37]|uniref:serine hydrolase n=1 Tax=Halomonas kashgarensis TaxID=3084920 RepID=UPI0032176EAF